MPSRSTILNRRAADLVIGLARRGPRQFIQARIKDHKFGVRTTAVNYRPRTSAQTGFEGLSFRFIFQCFDHGIVEHAAELGDRLAGATVKDVIG